MKIVFHDAPDGALVVEGPLTAKARAFHGIETDDEAVAFIEARQIAKGAANVRAVDVASFPDRTYRGAWAVAGNRVEVNMTKARDIQVARITAAKRHMARDLLERETMGEDITADKAALQAMNARPQIDAAQTPDALKAVWPAGLPRP